MDIISKQIADQLIADGNARAEGLVVSQLGNGAVATYMAVTRLDVQATTHYKVADGELRAPAGAIAWKYADPTEGARWVYEESDLAEIRSADPSLVVELPRVAQETLADLDLYDQRSAVPSGTYMWRTDAAHGDLQAESMDAAVAQLIAQGEWSAIDGRREARDIADGAWLLVRDTQTGAEYRRGETP